MTPEDLRKTAFAMPLSSPSYPVGPYRFVDREYEFVHGISFRIDPDGGDHGSDCGE
jgi:acetoacetate decarboxylase